MATLKATVQRHHKRRDGKYPVSIRLTQNQRVLYIPTGIYITQRQIHPKTFEIKDQFVIERMNDTIRTYEKRMLNLTTEELVTMSCEGLRDYLTASTKKVDYFEFCDWFIKKNPKSTGRLHNALCIVKEEMGIKRMMATDFTSAFLRSFKDTLDTREVIQGSKRRKMAVATKFNYFNALCWSFKEMCKRYNTEFYKVITHDPLINIEGYERVRTPRKTIEADLVKQLFEFGPLPDRQKTVMEMLKMEFCMCGMNTRDLITLEKSSYNPETRRITYNRSKTKDSRKDQALTSVRVEPEIYDLFEKYLAKKGNRLFDFGSLSNEKCATRTIGTYLDYVCQKMGLEQHINPYLFRHAWATIARNNCGISKDDVDLCLNHSGNNPMADEYIALDWSIIDVANRKVLDYVFHRE